jgi:hypothetical protein
MFVFLDCYYINLSNWWLHSFLFPTPKMGPGCSISFDDCFQDDLLLNWCFFLATTKKTVFTKCVYGYTELNNMNWWLLLHSASNLQLKKYGWQHLRGNFFQGPTSLQTHNFLIPNEEWAFFKEFLVTSKLGMSF